MKISYKLFAKCFAIASTLLVATGLYAQTPIEVVDTMTGQELVNALVDNACAEISNVTISGSNEDTSYGYFTADPDFPFESGIILSTGYVRSAPGPNTSVLGDGSGNWGGDNDLEQELNINNTRNATTLEFDFVPATSHISFDYIFASEEYTFWPDGDGCNYSDGFAFLLREAGSTDPYQNLAIIPGTNTPVQVTTVRGAGTCPSANTQYFDAFNDTDYPTNFNGQTVVLTAEADVTAGTLYHIKLVIADQGDTLYDAAVFLKANSFGSNVELGEDRLIAEGNAMCDGETLQLDATTPNATGYQWYHDEAQIDGATNALYIVDTPGDYRVEAILSPTCSATGEITVEYNPPIPSAPVTYYQCDDDSDGLTAYYTATMQIKITQNFPGLEVSDFFVTLADAQGNTNALPMSGSIPYYNTAPNQEIYARMYNEGGCTGIVPIILSTPADFADILPVYEVCDDDGTDDGFHAFSLEEFFYDNLLGGIPAGVTPLFYNSYDNALAFSTNILPPNVFTNTEAGEQTVYVNLSTEWGCFAIIEMPLLVHSFGGATGPVEAIVCQDETVTLDAGNYVSYLWDTTPPQNSRTITVAQPGNYTVTLTNNFGCEGTKTFSVAQSGRATNAAFDIDDFRGNDNTLTVTPVGSGSYEYSLNNTDWQESPVFSHLPGGKYTVYIRDINGCGPVYSETLYILDYPSFFTPNGDGVNDTWRIENSFFRPGISVKVFDRYGKFLSAFGGSGQGWDGELNGSPLPATDYWFIIELENGQEVRGHFSMLR